MISSSLSAEKKFKKILELNKIYDEVSEVTVKDSSVKQGMLTNNQFVTVHFKSPDKKPLELFVKVQTLNDSHNEMLSQLRAFEKEAQFFTDYLPAAEKFTKSKGMNDYADLYAKFYYGDSDITVFENIVAEKGYVMSSMEELQDLEEAKASLTTLAKHHAVSYAMIEEEGGPEKFLERFKEFAHESHGTPHAVKMLTDMFENAVQMSIKLLQQNCSEDSKRIISLLESFVTKTHPLYMDCIKYREGELSLLNHGDYYNNNMMLLRDPVTKKLISHKAVDLQLPRYASPAIDISVFLFSSVKGEVRREKFMELLEHYLQVLKSTSKALDHPIELSLEELFSSIKKKFLAGFWIGLVVAGPGYSVLQDFDQSKMGDISNLANYFDDLMQKWLKKNPEKAQIMAEKILNLMKEYEKLVE